jgi:hypothetical protein
MKKHRHGEANSKRLLNVFKLQIVQEIERGQLTMNPQRPMAFKIEQLLLNGSENSVTLIGKKPNTIYYVKVTTKDYELEAKVKLLEKQKSF